MRQIRESIALPVPADLAEQCILQYFERHRAAGGSIRIPLQINLGSFGLPGNVNLERTVTAHVSKQRDEQNLNDQIAMTWEPGDGEPFPTFSGRMTIWSEKPGKTFVELRGSYEPPLGVTGRLFDDAIGHVIARRTARQFLHSLAEGARACFQQ